MKQGPLATPPNSECLGVVDVELEVVQPKSGVFHFRILEASRGRSIQYFKKEKSQINTFYLRFIFGGTVPKVGNDCPIFFMGILATSGVSMGDFLFL